MTLDKSYFTQQPTNVKIIGTGSFLSDPSVCRFISEDPIGFDGGDVNLYAYCGNNPINFADPFGLEAEQGGAWWGNAWNSWSNLVTVDFSTANLIAREVANKYPSGHNNLEDAMRHAEWSKHRQQDKNSCETRDRIIRQLFFDYLNSNNKKFKIKDTVRFFNEAQRIAVYRREKGLCKPCLAEGKGEIVSTVSWSDYQTDHIISYITGVKTEEANAQVLCRCHNAQKGGR